jgi:hypothetical protein
MTTFYFRLIGIEDTLWRMICGAYRLITKQLPAWVYHVLFVSIGPVTIRLVSVFSLTCIWLTIVAGPFALGRIVHLRSWWSYGALLWALLAIAGSVLGLKHVATTRKASLL